MYAHKLKVVRYFHSTFTSRIRVRGEKSVFLIKLVPMNAVRLTRGIEINQRALEHNCL
jgi:hypothetical protein